MIEPKQEESAPKEGAQLLARGAFVTLKDGSHRLIFDYEALEFIEEQFDGIDVFMASLGETRYGKSRLRNVRHGVTAALLHEKPPEMSIEEFGRQVRDKIVPSELVQLLDGLLEAIMEAFPVPAEVDQAPKAQGSKDVSPGNGSITSPRSTSGARTRSSGA